ncbi:MAG: DUF2304 domain-containing protein [Candidatus Aminicenantales bacterium]
MSTIAIISMIVSAGLLVCIIELTRRRKIREQYSLIWIAVGFLILVFSIFNKLLDFLARLAGIYYAPSVLIVLMVFFGMVLGIHFTLVISKLAEDNKKLIQEIGLLKNRIETLEKGR